MIGIGVLLHTQVTLETPYLGTVRRSIREDVLKMESTLTTLTVQTRNHSKFIAVINTLSSREEWMDLRISIEVGMTMFRASVQSGVSIGLVWRRSTVSLQELPELKWESTWPISEEIRNTPTTTSSWSGMLLVSTSYRLQATVELQETAYSMAVEDGTSMEWHSPHMTVTMTCMVVDTVHKNGREDGGTTPACLQIWTGSTIMTQHQEPGRQLFGRHSLVVIAHWSLLKWNSELETSQNTRLLCNHGNNAYYNRITQFSIDTKTCIFLNNWYYNKWSMETLTECCHSKPKST